MSDVLLLYSGGKDSMYSACYFLSKGHTVHLLSFNNGALLAEEHLLHGYDRLHRLWGDNVVWEGVYGTAAMIKLFRKDLYTETLKDIAYKYPTLTLTQLQCSVCQTCMWLAAVSFAIAKGITNISCGYKSCDPFVTGNPDYVLFIENFCRQYGIEMATPVWDKTVCNLMDYEMSPQVLEPQCMLGLPADGTDSAVAVRFIVDRYLKQMPELVNHYVPMFKAIRLSDHAYNWVGYNREVAGDDG